MMKKKGKDWFHEITQKHKKLMDSGQLIWQRPFKLYGSFRNTDGVLYHGVNVLNLQIDCMLHGWETPVFITSSTLRKRQIKFSHLAGSGLHSAILRWVSMSYTRKARNKNTGEVLIDEDTGKEQTEQAQRMVLKFVGTVWNIELFPELMEEYTKPENDKNEKFPYIEELIGAYLSIQNAPKLHELPGRQPAYSPDNHTILMSTRNDFETNEAYYDTFFHELGHSTGHKSLLARQSLEQIARRGSQTYSQEELVAEFTTCFLDAEVGINRPDIEENAAAYLQGWWKALNNDEGMLARAMCNAQKAFHLIMGIEFENVEEKENV